MNFLERKTKKGDKIVFYYDFGRGKGQRPSTGIFVYTKPKDQAEKNHNKQALSLIELKNLPSADGANKIPIQWVKATSRRCSSAVINLK